MNLTLGNTEVLIDRAKKVNMLRNQLAYVLATAYWETARTMKPVKEAYYLIKTLKTEERVEAWRKKNLRYYPYYGRGYVQLTWKYNYVKASDELDIDLLSDLNTALEPTIAADICIAGMREGWFTGKKLSDFITLQKSDFENARRIINGMDEAETIARFAREYDNDLQKIGYGTTFRGGTSGADGRKDTAEPVGRLPDDPGVLHPDELPSSVEHSPGFSTGTLNFIEQLLNLIKKLFGGK